MVLLETLWDDVAGGPTPQRGLEKLRNLPLKIKTDDESSGSKFQRSVSMPGTPATPGTPGTATTPSPTAARKDNVWRSVFHPGSNRAGTRNVGAEMFDKPLPNTPTVYDWMYSGDTKSTYR